MSLVKNVLESFFTYKSCSKTSKFIFMLYCKVTQKTYRLKKNLKRNHFCVDICIFEGAELIFGTKIQLRDQEGRLFDITTFWGGIFFLLKLDFKGSLCMFLMSLKPLAQKNTDKKLPVHFSPVQVKNEIL